MPVLSLIPASPPSQGDMKVTQPPAGGVWLLGSSHWAQLHLEA